MRLFHQGLLLSLLFLSFICVVNAQANSKSSTNAKANKSDRPLQVKSKPKPDSQGCLQDAATMRVSVTFDKSAKVTEVKVILPSGCQIFDDNSVKAAMRIKFKPQIKDGEPITVIKQVEYSYYRY